MKTDEALFALVVTAFLFAAEIAVNSIAFIFLWGWFIVPIFHLPAISLIQSAGIVMVIGLSVHQYIPKKEKDIFKSVFDGLCTPVLYLIIGWVIHFFM